MTEQTNQTQPTQTDSAQTPSTQSSTQTTQTTPAAPQTQSQAPAKDDSTLLGKKTESTEGKPAEQAGVPEKYEIKAPEGMTIDNKALESMTPLFRELKLTQEQVQKLSDTYAPIVKASTEAAHNQAMKDYNDLTEGWKAETIKELGADYAKSLAPASALLDKYPQGDKVRELLEETRVGNHPEMVKFMIWLGKSIKSDSFPDQGKVTTTDKFDDKIDFKVKD